MDKIGINTRCTMYVDFQSYTSIEALHNKYNIYFPEQKNNTDFVSVKSFINFHKINNNTTHLNK